MRQAVEDYLKFLDSELQPDVAADAREVVLHFQRESLLDFSSTVGAIEVAQLTRKHLVKYAAALHERGTDKVTRDIRIENAQKFLAWLRGRERPTAIGRFIGQGVATAIEWFKRARS